MDRESDANENKKLAAIVVLTCTVLAILFVVIVPKKSDDPPPPRRITTQLEPAPEVVDEPEPDPDPIVPRAAKGCAAKEPPFTGIGKLTHGVLYDTQAYIPRSYVPGEKHPVLLFVSDRLVKASKRSVTAGKVPLPESHDFFRLAESRGIVIVGTRGVGDGSTEFAHRAIDMATENLCIDPDRIYAFAVNRGVNSIASALCETSIRAIATAGGRAVPRCARPHIHFVETQDRSLFEPEGACTFLPTRAIDDFTEGLKTVNGCKGFQEADDCKMFECDVGLAICTVDGGRMQTPKASYVDNFATHGEPLRPRERPCYGTPNPDFPYALKTWGFFEYVEKMTPKSGADAGAQ